MEALRKQLLEILGVLLPLLLQSCDRPIHDSYHHLDICLLCVVWVAFGELHSLDCISEWAAAEYRRRPGEEQAGNSINHLKCGHAERPDVSTEVVTFLLLQNLGSHRANAINTDECVSLLQRAF